MKARDASGMFAHFLQELDALSDRRVLPRQKPIAGAPARDAVDVGDFFQSADENVGGHGAGAEEVRLAFATARDEPKEEERVGRQESKLDEAAEHLERVTDVVAVECSKSPQGGHDVIQ